MQSHAVVSLWPSCADNGSAPNSLPASGIGLDQRSTTTGSETLARPDLICLAVVGRAGRERRRRPPRGHHLQHSAQHARGGRPNGRCVPRPWCLMTTTPTHLAAARAAARAAAHTHFTCKPMGSWHIGQLVRRPGAVHVTAGVQASSSSSSSSVTSAVAKQWRRQAGYGVSSSSTTLLAAIAQPAAAGNGGCPVVDDRQAPAPASPGASPPPKSKQGPWSELGAARPCLPLRCRNAAGRMVGKPNYQLPQHPRPLLSPPHSPTQPAGGPAVAGGAASTSLVSRIFGTAPGPGLGQYPYHH